mgnify:CR=1 FL=1
MSFHPKFDELPETLPIFPLPGAVVLPHSALPLNIFEPRYLEMVRDALTEPCRLIGMVQPQVEQEDAETVFSVGCAGRVSAFQETDDGRYMIQLTGVCRFLIRDELSTERGYRRFRVDWSAYAADLAAPDAVVDLVSLKSALASYIEKNQLSLSWEAVDELGGEELTNALTQSLPFGVEDKQLLLEAPSLDDRVAVLTALLARGSGSAVALH